MALNPSMDGHWTYMKGSHTFATMPIFITHS
jgi:hypothetical protein